MTYGQDLLRRKLYDMREECAANALLQEEAQVISETLGGDQSLYVAAWANYSPDDFVSLWRATCLSVGVNPNHKAVRSEDFAKKVVELGSAAGRDFEALKEVIRRYKNVRLNAEIADSGLKFIGERHKEIELSDFGKWATKKNWELPKGFPGAPAPLPSTDQPQATTPIPAPVVAAGASDTPATQRNIMKKAALIAALEHEWTSIEADISDATRNGLKTAAHAVKHGEWDAGKARAWAVSKGKIKQTAPVHHLASAWP